MIKLQNITKTYTTGELTQMALNDVSVNFRQNEFVAILGPSGSGKTTLLNIIGGLDKYDKNEDSSGDVIIKHISTKEYEDKDWDTYRNRTVGFIFQNYNLIPHQTILSNVELAMTLAGVSKAERTAAAKTALYQVGLASHMHKNPTQLSGGQMQRVAIARALVNNPDIVLADEPTGALDSETSTQIMEMLKNVAKDRLVVMVTHNQELADTYASRIINIKDGQIVYDSNPYEDETPDVLYDCHPQHATSTMSLSTALNLSWTNLQTKKTRSLLTACAGSLGIVGIALILALSTGMNRYISDTQKTIMASYPVQIQQESVDLASLIIESSNTAEDVVEREPAVYADMSTLNVLKPTNNVITNDLEAFKVWLDNSMNPMHQFVSTNGIVYNYDVDFEAYTYDEDENLVAVDGVNVSLQNKNTNITPWSPLDQFTDTTMHMFTPVLSNKKGEVDPLVKEQYELIEGEWPTDPTDVIVMLDKNGEVPAVLLYGLGMRSMTEYQEMISKLDKGEEIDNTLIQLSYDQFVGRKIKLVLESDKYINGDSGEFAYYGSTIENLQTIINDYSTELTICGVVQAKDKDAMYSQPLGYTSSLTEYMLERLNNSNVVQSQIGNPEVNVLTGYAFVASSNKDKIREVKTYFNNMSDDEKANYGRTIILSMKGDSDETRDYISGMSENDLIKVTQQQIAAMTDTDYLNLYSSLIVSATYETNLEKFGYVNKDKPTSIDIYTNSFNNKNKVIQYINAYNKSVEESQQITYTDYVGLMMSSITTIINSVSYVLMALVSVSLVVSCIMIGIITNISVIERTKEIGILRAIGASKQNISDVFNAETAIIGCASGVIGILAAALLTIPINAIIAILLPDINIRARIPFLAFIVLIAISIGITIVGGLYPAKKASNMDPVKALRSE